MVWTANAAWSVAPFGAAPAGRSYLDALQDAAPLEGDTHETLTLLLGDPAKSDGVVREQTLERQIGDSEQWFTVSLSAVSVGGRRAWLVLHQDRTAVVQMERRLLLTRRLATALSMAHDPSRRTQLVASAIGDVLRASLVVLWERSASGALRAHPLDMRREAPQVATIAHTRQLLRAMDGTRARWLPLPDGTPCFAVPLRAGSQVVLFHFRQGPRVDPETMRLAARALHAEPSLREPAKGTRGRSPREVRLEAMRAGDPTRTNLAMQERQHIERTLAQYGNNVVHTAHALGIARSTLYERLRDYALAARTRPT